MTQLRLLTVITFHYVALKIYYAVVGNNERSFHLRAKTNNIFVCFEGFQLKKFKPSCFVNLPFCDPIKMFFCLFVEVDANYLAGVRTSRGDT